MLSHLEVRKREFDGKEHQLSRNEVNEKKKFKTADAQAGNEGHVFHCS